MTRSALPDARKGLAAALAVSAALAGAPALAQDTTAAPAATTSTTAAAADCTPGGLGEGGTFTARRGAADGIVRAEIAFQCERTLSDGTYVPEGYRVQLYETCDSGECELPFLFVSEGRNDSYAGQYDDNGTPTQLRFRTNRNDGLVITAVTGGGRGQQGERERERYTLRRGS
jgi:hypothetical protein